MRANAKLELVSCCRDVGAWLLLSGRFAPAAHIVDAAVALVCNDCVHLRTGGRWGSSCRRPAGIPRFCDPSCWEGLARTQRKRSGKAFCSVRLRAMVFVVCDNPSALRPGAHKTLRRVTVFAGVVGISFVGIGVASRRVCCISRRVACCLPPMCHTSTHCLIDLHGHFLTAPCVKNLA